MSVPVKFKTCQDFGELKLFKMKIKYIFEFQQI